jgi:hypothetical protein
MSEWMDIDSAPRDRMILLYRPDAPGWGQVAPGKWSDEIYARRPKPYWELWLKFGGVTDARLWLPTHWMPLPEPPK